MSGGVDWLIWSNEHRRWWGPGEHGYTSDVTKAGRYTEERAKEICDTASNGWHHPNQPPPEIAVPPEAIPVRLVKDFPCLVVSQTEAKEEP